MKKRTLILVGLFAVLLFIGLVVFWPNGVTNIKLSGTAGARITGYYIQNGQRFDVVTTLPWSLQRYGITEFEFRKADTTGVFTLKINRSGTMGGFAGCTSVSGGAGQGVIGFHGQLDHWSILTRGVTMMPDTSPGPVPVGAGSSAARLASRVAGGSVLGR